MSKREIQLGDVVVITPAAAKIGALLFSYANSACIRGTLFLCSGEITVDGVRYVKLTGEYDTLRWLHTKNQALIEMEIIGANT